MSVLWRTVAVSILAGTLWLTACGQAAQSVVETTTGVKVDQQGDKITIKSKEGEVIAGTQLPEEFKNFPVPQGFSTVSGVSINAPKENAQGVIASWQGKGTTRSVVDFYKKALPDQGWKEELSMDAGTSSQLGFVKGDNNVMVIVDTQNEQVTLTAIMAKSDQAAASGGSSSGSGSPPTGSGSPSTQGAAKPEPAPKVVPPTPQTTDSSALPAELKDLPIPNGFALERDSAQRLVVGGTFQAAQATLVGRGEPAEVGAFYQKSLPQRGWTEEAYLKSEDSVTGLFSTTRDGGFQLAIEISKDEDDTRVGVIVTK